MSSDGEMKATHCGWFLFAPVYLDMTTPEEPGMWARWECMEFLVVIAHGMQVAMMNLLQAIDPDYEPMWMIRITGEVS